MWKDIMLLTVFLLSGCGNNNFEHNNKFSIDGNVNQKIAADFYVKVTKLSGKCSEAQLQTISIHSAMINSFTTVNNYHQSIINEYEECRSGNIGIKNIEIPSEFSFQERLEAASMIKVCSNYMQKSERVANLIDKALNADRPLKNLEAYSGEYEAAKDEFLACMSQGDRFSRSAGIYAAPPPA